ncbi:alkaline phosphatase family protein [Neobacillus terrae]|uniref:alkaline phosphatase family protein n=1 Tax=Neobacillus terrae TaxID=3034837 RepID=UPI00140AE07F|nr:alkaline phosphatase family protein [Neobacillus terrae]NHM32918.1 alkaline phosphatase family protein [Neobacillus terrae]
MTTRLARVLVLVFFILAGFSQEAVFAETNNKQVILISFDGMRNDLMRRYVKEGKLPHIKKVFKNGTIAKYSTTISPSLTAPSHAAIATGASPLKTSVVSNVWQQSGASLTNKKDAFLTRPEVDPLWLEAKQQGKTTATIAFPGAVPQKGKEADYTVYYGETWSPSNNDKLTFRKASNWRNTPKSYSTPKESELHIEMKNKKNQTYYVLAIDTTNDKKINYKKFIVSKTKELNQEDKAINPGNWGSISIPVKDGQTAGFWYRFSLGDEKLEKETEMYRTAVTSGRIDGPDHFKKEVKDRFGFFPVEADDTAFEKGWITRKEYEQISERFVEWVTDVSLFIKKEYNPDLVILYAPQIDHQEHRYLMSDPRQPGYSPEKSKKYQNYIEWSYRVADTVVGKTVKSLDKNDILFIVSDHGMEPAHSMLEPNKVLKDEGLLVLDEKGNVDPKKTKAIAIPSGSAAHVYINLDSREKSGIVPQKNYKKVRDEVIKAFKDEKIKRTEGSKVVSHYAKEMWDSLTNEGLTLSSIKEDTKDMTGYITNREVHLYEEVRILHKSEKAIKKDNHEGDILLMAAPGYIMGNGASESVKPSPELGTHGGNPYREKLKAVFMAAGSDIEKGKQIKPVSNLDIAPTVYNLLGLKTPSFVEGKRIKGLIDK